MKRVILATALSAFSSAVAAQTMIEAPFLATAHMKISKGGAAEHCGIELFGIIDRPDNRRVLVASVYVSATGYGFIKMVSKEGSMADTLNGMQSVNIYDGWVKAQGKPAAVPIADISSGDQPGSIIFAASFQPSMEALTAIAEGRQVQVAFGWDKEKQYKSVYFGSPHMEPSQKDQFYACIGELADAIEKAM